MVTQSTTVSSTATTSHTGLAVSPKSATARKNGARVLSRRSFSLVTERTALIRLLKSAETNWYAMCCDLRDAGQHWLNIKAECRARRISAGTWAVDNAPLSKRWLDKFAEFAGRWDEFRLAWKWSQSLGYAPERRPGLWGCFDLMDAKARFDTYSGPRRESYGGSATMGTVVPIAGTKPSTKTAKNPIKLTATATLLHGDVTEMMAAHVTSESVDVIIADVPYFMRKSSEVAVTDFHVNQNGMKPLFNEPWDRFDDIADYETFCSAWIDEAMRCLNVEGSLFVFGTHHNTGLVNRICQMKGLVIVNEIIWLQRNGRPNVATRRLQSSHHNILWVAKDIKQYRFNYRLCRRTAYDDWLSVRNQQLRDVWDIPTNGHENKARHPSPKPLAVMARILDVAGKPGGLLLDLFSGSGTAAVAASKWGMRSSSIEREAAYVQMIRERVAAEAGADNRQR
jgi:DNA modification methylase